MSIKKMNVRQMELIRYLQGLDKKEDKLNK